MKMLNDSNALNKYEIIQPPSFTTIDGQMTGTFISYSRHRFGDAELETVEQFWLTYVGSLDYYLMSFIAPIQSFSNSDNAMIRNHLVNSIKLLDATDMAKLNFHSFSGVGTSLLCIHLTMQSFGPVTMYICTSHNSLYDIPLVHSQAIT